MEIISFTVNILDCLNIEFYITIFLFGRTFAFLNVKLKVN